jgi:hypothetical protein
MWLMSTPETVAFIALVLGMACWRYGQSELPARRHSANLEGGWLAKIHV